MLRFPTLSGAAGDQAAQSHSLSLTCLLQMLFSAKDSRNRRRLNIHS